MDRLYVIVYQNVSSSDKNFDLVTYIYVMMSTYSHIYVTKSIFLSDDPTFRYTITYSQSMDVSSSDKISTSSHIYGSNFVSDDSTFLVHNTG